MYHIVGGLLLSHCLNFLHLHKKGAYSNCLHTLFQEIVFFLFVFNHVGKFRLITCFSQSIFPNNVLYRFPNFGKEGYHMGQFLQGGKNGRLMSFLAVQDSSIGDLVTH